MRPTVWAAQYESAGIHPAAAGKGFMKGLEPSLSPPSSLSLLAPVPSLRGPNEGNWDMKHLKGQAKCWQVNIPLTPPQSS